MGEALAQLFVEWQSEHSPKKWLSGRSSAWHLTQLPRLV
jgi:hypothetical protein